MSNILYVLGAAFGEVKKRVRTTAGGSTGSVRNLRIREDTAKYLLNLDVNSAHYDPKSRCVSACVMLRYQSKLQSFDSFTAGDSYTDSQALHVAI